MKRSDIETFNNEIDRLIADGERTLSIIYTDVKSAKGSILLDSVIEAQLFLSDRRIRRQHLGSSVTEHMTYEATKNDIPDEFSVEKMERAMVMTAVALPRLEQRIRDGMGDDPCAYFNSIRLKYPYKRERKRPPRRSDRTEP